MAATGFPEKLTDHDQMIWDLAYEGLELLVEDNLKTWRQMGIHGSPEELLAASGQSNDYDEGFFRGGAVALAALMSEVSADRSSLFLA